ncbi:type II 3-dehydroquinate dehydratase [Bartonella sp. DGB2]|uniref:type II 3-dehydroquinate dehydratase n=1 Tax=Bartonella sp. DGB2 TaxID=3388426 RepID=UPI0039901670
MQKQITVINGPNLNMLGRRPVSLYGHERLEDINALCCSWGQEHDFRINFLQSNHEGQLVDWIQEACDEAAGLVINPAAYGHTSVALLDTLEIFTGPIVEVHLSNIHAREDFRHNTYTATRAKAIIAGCGAMGYYFALDYLARLFSNSGVLIK